MNWKQLLHETDDWIIGLIAAAAAVGFLVLVRRFVLSHFKKKEARNQSLASTVMVSLAERTRYLAAFLVGTSAFLQFNTFTPKIESSLQHLITVIFFLQLGAWGSAAIHVWIDRVLYTRIAKDPAQATSFALVTYAVRGIFYTLLILLGLNNLGFNISALVAGLGVGGIAVALAVQSILGDLFASLTIVLDKPFVVGDSIGIDTFSGTVEHIGMKTTRIRSTTGEQLIFSNSDLLKSRLKNYQRQNTRVLTLQIGFDCETSRASLEQIPHVIRSVIEAQPKVTFQRCHLYQFGKSSLDFETVYTIQTSDYGFYMNTQQKILLQLLSEFQRLQIKMPFPTQTIFLEAPSLTPHAQPQSTAAPHSATPLENQNG